MYIDNLRNKLLQQQCMYQAVKTNHMQSVSYQKSIDPTYGTYDKNYVNRLRLAYYMLYEHIQDEPMIVYLFEEELKDRETNSFQGIGETLPVLTHLLKSLDIDHKYEALFKRAKNANFDCFCGYDENEKIDDEIHHHDLLDSIYLCQKMKYDDLMDEFVEMWKQEITQWDNAKLDMLIRFYTYLGKESEKEQLYEKQLTSVLSTNDVWKILTAYSNLIKYHLENHHFETAYSYLITVIETLPYEDYKTIRLFDDLLECSLDLICQAPQNKDTLWTWAKPYTKGKTNMYGNLYTKAINAAKIMQDPYATQLEQEYSAWKKKVGIS